MKKIAVIAGTPVDTSMGVEFLRKQNVDLDPLYLPFAENPRECHLFQLQSKAYKHKVMKMIMKSAVNKGAEGFFIYCNSLSAAVDYDALMAELEIPVITPMSAYKKMSQSFNCLGVIAANNQATKGIEDAFTAADENAYVIGCGNLKLVEAVEAKLPPESIVRDFNLFELSCFFKANGCHAIALGCTHFPYFKDALESVSVLPVIDPADIMYEMLMDV